MHNSASNDASSNGRRAFASARTKRARSGWPERSASFEAVRTDNDAYNETGAGPANLSVDRMIVNAYDSTIGVKASTVLGSTWGDFMPEIKLAWVHDFNGDAVPTSAMLDGVRFVTTTPRAAQDGAQVTLALTLLQGNVLSLRTEYFGDLRPNYQSHNGFMKMKWNY